MLLELLNVDLYYRSKIRQKTYTLFFNGVTRLYEKHIEFGSIFHRAFSRQGEELLLLHDLDFIFASSLCAIIDSHTSQFSRQKSSTSRNRVRCTATGPSRNPHGRAQARPFFGYHNT